MLATEERHLLGSLKKNTTLEYSTRVVQEGDRRCEKSTLNDLAYLTPLRIPLMNPVTMNTELVVGLRNKLTPIKDYYVYFCRLVGLYCL
jgi:hypothetical protein